MFLQFQKVNITYRTEAAYTEAAYTRTGEIMEYGIIGDGSQISTNQKRESTVFSLLIGENLRPFPENTYRTLLEVMVIKLINLITHSSTFVGTDKA